MYAHLIKGATLGNIIARRALRTLFAIPGFALDLVVGVFWQKGFEDYWNNQPFTFSDNTSFTYCAGVTGWVGDTIGLVLGTIAGGAIGAVLFFPDTAMNLIKLGVRFVTQNINDFASYISKTPFFNQQFQVFDPESKDKTELTSYLSTAWNIGTVVAGAAVFVPYVACRAIEYFLPIGNVVSSALLKGAGYVGGAIASALGIFPGLLITHALKKCCDLHDAIHRSTNKATAVVYAKTNTNIPSDWDMNPIKSHLVYDDKFRKKHQKAQNKSWADILFKLNDKKPKKKIIMAGELEDAITGKSFHKSKRDIITIPCGHSFLDYTGKNKGINQWMLTEEEKNKDKPKPEHKNCTCPICRKEFKREQIVNNIAANEYRQAIKKL